MAWIKERCVDNAVGLDGQLRCARQPEVQSKLNVLGATAAEAAVQVKSCETNPESGYENRSLVFSYADLAATGLGGV